MMEFEADRMRNLILTDDVIGPERDVILEERRSRIENNPEALLSRGGRRDALPEPSLPHPGHRLDAGDGEAEPRGRGGLLRPLLRAEQRHPDRGRRRRCEGRCARWPRRPMARCRADRTCRRASGRRSRSRTPARTVTLTDPRVIDAELLEVMAGAVLPHRRSRARPRRSTCCRRSSAAASAAASTRSWSSRRASPRRPAPISTAPSSTSLPSRSTARRAATAKLDEVRGGDRRGDRANRQGRRRRTRNWRRPRTASCARMIFARDNQSSHGQYLRRDARDRRHRGGCRGMAGSDQEGHGRRDPQGRRQISQREPVGDRLPAAPEPVQN